MAELRQRGIRDVKVAWGTSSMANGFYVRCGFKLAATREFHGRATNMYVIHID